MPNAVDTDSPPSPDLLDGSYDDAYVGRVIAVLADSPGSTYRLSTNDLDRLAALLEHGGRRLRHAADGTASGETLATAEWPLPNVRIGTEVASAADLQDAIAALAPIPAAGRFIRVAPGAGELDLAPLRDAGIGVVYLGPDVTQAARESLSAQCGLLGLECVPI